jgi:hypothetical protein
VWLPHGIHVCVYLYSYISLNDIKCICKNHPSVPASLQFWHIYIYICVCMCHVWIDLCHWCDMKTSDGSTH